jgi:primosomal protein N' (replication factor Y)
VYADIVFQDLEGKAFTYLLSEETNEYESISGARVLVPFRKGLKRGYILRVFKEKPRGIKGIKKVSHVITPVIPPQLFKLALWMCEYYYISAGKMLHALYPAPARISHEERLYPGPRFSKASDLLKKSVPARGISKAVLIKKNKNSFSLVEEALREAILISEIKVKDGKRKKKMLYYQGPEGMPETISPQARRQKEIILRLQAVGGKLPYEEIGPSSALSALEKQGLVAFREEDTNDGHMQERDKEQLLCINELSDKQKEIFRSIDQQLFRGFSVHLIHGITGSGKTEIYLHLMKNVLSRGLDVLYLVPEVALTTHLTRRLEAAFGHRATILHSYMNSKERYQSWSKAFSSRGEIFIGPRSALFTPSSSLGLIIIDEEHESAFKQDESPRYHGRDAAIYRGKIENIPVVLGSATPSVESYYNAVVLNKYKLYSLNERFQTAVLPCVSVVDMRKDVCKGGKTYPFSTEMIRHLEDRFQKKEQSILFINRKGYHTALICKECGAPLECPHCSRLMTYYKERHILQCHLCSYSYPRENARCSTCGKTSFVESGMGTEKIMEKVKQLFPDMKAMRIDGSIVARHETVQSLFGEFEKGKSDLLIGTQMIAKGIDFENVTFVGVISADAMMNMPDFRANERTFQLISQVAGRSGRGRKRGEALIQTWMPAHYVIQSAIRHDYRMFFENEILFRKELGYPPFTRFCRIIFENREQSVLEKEIRALERVLPSLTGPGAEAFFQEFEKTPKRANLYRAFLLIKSKEIGALRQTVAAVQRKAEQERTRVFIDMDPYYLGL